MGLNSDFLKNWKKLFFTIWAGQAVSLVGSNLAQFALIWWITKSTGSATILATASLVGMLPQVLLGPFAGTLVDRWNRRLVMIVADSLIAFFSLILALLFASGHVQVWHIFVILCLRSAGGAFHWPAMQASTSLMVPKEQLSRVAGMNQTLFGIMNIAAPPLGAFLLMLIPIYGILMIDVVTACVAVIPLFFIMVPQPQRTADRPVDELGDGLGPAAAPGTTIWQEFRAGLAYVSRWPGLMILLGIATVLNFLFNPAFTLVPLLVTKYFNGDAMQLGLINSFCGVGMVAGGLILSAWGGFQRRIVTSMVGLVGMGLGVTLIGFAPANLFGMAVVGMALSGLMNPICNGPINAILQSAVAPDMQGRVMTLVSSAAGLMSPLSLAIAGPVSDALGIQVWFVAAGLLSMLMAVACLMVPAVMQIEQGRDNSAVSDLPVPLSIQPE
jgi:MFS transporter, DHA3 family, macrolide efflux protein